MREENKPSQKDTFEGIFTRMEQLEHEQVMYCYDEPTSLKAIIAIHNTALGPALGGVRMWNYTSEQDALVDVLRLSRGMSFKAAITGLKLGGGKSVIIGDAKTIKTETLLRQFGKFVQRLGGNYISAPDVNMKTEDMQHIGMETRHVTGLPENMGGGGSPAPATAYGTYLGIKASVKKKYGTDNLRGKKIVVQGVGQVGSLLVELLLKEDAQIAISDIFPEKTNAVAKQFDVNIVDEKGIYDLDMDIYAPCALGGSLNDDVIARLKCSIIAGSANNQLENESRHSQMLTDRGIIYVPDFLINAGGLINVYHEYLGNYNKEKAYLSVESIYDTCLEIFATAEVQKINNQEAAMCLAKKQIAIANKSTTSC